MDGTTGNIEKKRDWAYKEETRRMTFGINAKPGLVQTR